VYVTVGSYSTPDNAAWSVISSQAKISPRGRVISQQITWEVSCVLGAGSGLTQAGLTSLINTHITGMKQQNVDMTLYDDDDVATAHKITNSQTANGVTFLGYSFPGYFRGQWGAGSEYAAGAGIRYVVTRHTAEVFDVEDPLLFYEQSIQYSTGGFDYECPEALNGQPQYQITKQQAALWAIQRGYAVGMFSRPNAPASLIGQPKPKISWVRPITPKNQGRLQNFAYGIAWHYYAMSPGSLAIAPPDSL